MKCKKILQRLKRCIVLLFPLYAGCSSTSYSVSGDPYGSTVDLFNQYYNSIRPFVMALAALGIAYNAIIIIMGPMADNRSGDHMALARRRIIIIICAVIAFVGLKALVNSNLASTWYGYGG